MKNQELPSSIQLSGKFWKNRKEDFLQELGLAPLLGAHHYIYVSPVKNKKLEDLSDEVILKVFNFLELPDLIRCGLVSKRIRSVSFIESLWQKIDILNSDNSRKKIVSTELVKRIINRGCKSLSLRGCKVKGTLQYSDFSLDSNYWSDQDKKIKNIKQTKTKNKLRTHFGCSWSNSTDCELTYKKDTQIASQLIHLDLTQCDIKRCVLRVLLTACHSLKKLTLQNLLLNHYIFQRICIQNGQTLETLDLTFTRASPCEFKTRDMRLIVKNCIRLKEVDFSGCRLSENCMKLLVNNLSPNVEKVSLGAYGTYTEDMHIDALVSRCNKITSLNLAFRVALTDISLTSIMKNLKFTLEELDIGRCENITYTKLLEMRSMPKLKALNYSTYLQPEDHEELKKILPQLTNNNPWQRKWEDLGKWYIN